MTADERINALLERAGSPLMFVANPELHTVQKEPIYDTLEDCIEAIVKDRTRGLCDTIDRLEIALHNVLNERDQLLKDVSGICDCCTFAKLSGSMEPCHSCSLPNGISGFQWRGVPDKEGEA